MGFGGISLWQLLIILVIVVLLFGTKKLRGIGTDLGGAVKGFRGAMKEGEEGEASKPQEQVQAQVKHEGDTAGRVIDSEVTNKDEKKV